MKKMPKQTSETKTKKRTQIKDLPGSEKTLTARELGKVKGGVGGPCNRALLGATGPCDRKYK